MVSIAARFAKAQEELHQIPLDEVERGLHDRKQGEILELWHVIEDPNSPKSARDETTLRYGLSARAEHDLARPDDTEGARTLVPSWLQTARTELETFMDENPDSRRALSQTEFLSQDFATLMKLDRSIYSSVIERGGSYDSHAFAAALVTNKLVVRSSSVPELSTPVSQRRLIKKFSLRRLKLVRTLFKQGLYEVINRRAKGEYHDTNDG
jgi:hypothetical protein